MFLKYLPEQTHKRGYHISLREAFCRMGLTGIALLAPQRRSLKPWAKVTEKCENDAGLQPMPSHICCPENHSTKGVAIHEAHVWANA